MDALQSRLRDASDTGVTLTKSDCLLLLENSFSASLTLRFGRSKAVLRNLHRSKLSVDFVKEQATSIWTEALKDAQFSLYTEKDTDVEVNDSYLQLCVSGITVYVRTRQKGFSDFTENEALQYAGIEEISLVKNDHSAFPTPTKIGDDDPLLLETMKELEKRHNLYDPIEEGCENTRREFISPILVLAATISDVKLACEEQIDGSSGKGPVDWVAHYGNHRICITEGKKDNLTQGLYQNLAQLAAAGRVTMGIFLWICLCIKLLSFTMYSNWVFTCLDPAGSFKKECCSSATHHPYGCFQHSLLSPNGARCCF